MRCERCSAIDSASLVAFLDTVPHHSSFTDLETAAAAGCEVCQVLLWNARLHQPHIGTYDVDLSKARAATGPLRLTREEERLMLKFGGDPANNTSELSYSVELRSDLPSTNLAQVPTGNDPGSVRHQLLQWLSSCDVKHSACKTLRGLIDDGSKTARLLNLGSSGAPKLRLFPTSNDPLKYAALTYIWGPDPHGAMTLKSNLKERLLGITFDSLPRVYREAIELCRLLCIPYLWIDVLCIVQPEDGDDEDWQQQSAIMGAIYANAYVTIAAAATQAANDRLFGPGRITGNPPPPCTIFQASTTPKQNMYLIPAFPFWTIQISHSHLQARGWFFQERLMSIRIIHLTTYEACWECPNLIGTEHHPTGVPAEFDSVELMSNQF